MLKSVFLIAIVVVAMIGVMVPSVFANHNPQTTLIENGGTFDKEGKERGCFAERGTMVFSFEVCPNEWWEKQADIEWEKYIQKNIEKGGIMCERYENYPVKPFFFTEGWDDGTPGKLCPEKYIRAKTMLHWSNLSYLDLNEIINCPAGTQSVLVRQAEHDCLPVQTVQPIQPIQPVQPVQTEKNIFSDLSDTIISESSKVISEYSKDSDVVIEQNIESVKDTSNKKLVCPSNSYFGMDNDGNVVCRDLKTNKIVPSISGQATTQTTTQTSNPQKSPSFWDMLSQFFQNLFGGFSSEPIENSINQITKDIPEKINQVVDNQLQQAEKLIPNIPINPIPTAECLSKEGEKRVTCLMGVNSNVKTEDWTYADYDYVVDWWQTWCGTSAGLFCGLYYDQIMIAYDRLY